MRKPDAIIEMDLPPNTSHPNARAPWQKKAFPAKRYATTQGELVWLAAHQIGHPKWSSVVIRATVVLPAVRGGGNDKPMDPDNILAWLKLPIDLLQRHGILADDRDVIYLPPVQSRSPKPVPGLLAAKTGLTLEIWQRREGECPFCGTPTDRADGTGLTAEPIRQ